MAQHESKNSKEALLEAAKRLFIEKGYEAVGTRELAEAAGVNLGGIQYHFGSKAKLFMETLHGLMEGGSYPELRFKLQGAIHSKKDAGIKLGEFIVSFLQYLILCEGPQPCRMMFREIFSNTSTDKELYEALTSSVVKDFIKPVDDTLIEILKHLAPKATPEELGHCAQSIVGQCAFYLTHRPFVERLRDCNFSNQQSFLKIAEHIIRFSLQGLQCDQAFVSEVLKTIQPQLRKEKIK